MIVDQTVLVSECGPVKPKDCSIRGNLHHVKIYLIEYHKSLDD